MDLETVQLLNLSPIPELSELELSTMLEQLSGLSDLNGDLTDRNVEDILKEAENLIDSSMGSKMNEVQLTDQTHENIEKIQGQDVESININEPQESLSDSKNTPTENISPKPSPKRNNDDKNCSSPVEQSNKIFSPGGSSNVIKSTIDSLKEFSTLVEKQLSSRSSGSPKENQRFSDEHLHKVDSVKSPTPISKITKEKTKQVEKKNPDSIRMNRATKLPNCFERLYQDRPNRFIKKHKVTDKIPKIGMKKKVVKEVKSQTKPGKSSWNKVNESNNLRCKVIDRMTDNSLPKHYLEVENWLRNSDTKYSSQFDVPTKRVEVESDNDFVPYTQRNDFKMDNSSGISTQLDEKLLLKLLQGMEEIKEHVIKVGAVKNQVPEKMIQESQAVIDNLKSEVESVRKKVTSETIKNEGIQRLEEQFGILKVKYEEHMKKLEEENLKLREALCQKYNAESEPLNEVSTPEKIINRSFSLENCSAHRNSFCSSMEDIRQKHKEACSQTEKEPQNMSIQCFEEVTIEEEFTAKTENKENVANKKKPVREKPFSEKNIQQLLKQKRVTSEHETQLLATLRGLQAEVNMKEKENRKLKTEIDLLKSQIKKTGKRTEACKKRHIGTQTIGLGPVVQKPYNPEMYEVPRVFEKENEELKSKIKALEEDFELLKKKRVNDLQALHQVHEEEMAKLLSKLETQSALTKHLHSLLVNR